MGGPCLIVDGDGNKRMGPPCTDNFQIAPFEFNGKSYFSAEQAFQSMKFPEGSLMRQTIEKLKPLHDESGSDFGKRLWQLGQRRGQPIVSYWEDIKLEVMYLVNCAKYAYNRDLQQELVDETGDETIVGPESSWQWSKWNGYIQMLIRQKLNGGVHLSTIMGLNLDELRQFENKK